MLSGAARAMTTRAAPCAFAATDRVAEVDLEQAVPQLGPRHDIALTLYHISAIPMT